MTTTNFEDFYEVPSLNFNILRLRDDLEKILKAKKFNSPGVTHFGAIPLNQIPNDKSSIEGNKTTNIKEKTLKSEDFFLLVKAKVEKTSKILNLINQ